MLVLQRKASEKVIIGDGITLTVAEVQGSRVRIGIEAPANVRILRKELAGGKVNLAVVQKSDAPSVVCE